MGVAVDQRYLLLGEDHLLALAFIIFPSLSRTLTRLNRIKRLLESSSIGRLPGDVKTEGLGARRLL